MRTAIEYATVVAVTSSRMSDAEIRSFLQAPDKFKLPNNWIKIN